MEEDGRREEEEEREGRTGHVTHVWNARVDPRWFTTYDVWERVLDYGKMK